MSLEIKHIILHSLRQDSDGKMAAATRSEELSLQGSTADFVGQLHQIYNAKPGKVLGCFNSELSEEQSFEALLQRHKRDDEEFVTMSIEATSLLVESLNRYGFEEQGVLVFAHYNWVGCDYLLVTLLGHKESVSVNHQLELNHSNYLDLQRMQLAARIDLTAWQVDADSGRYLSFIKGRAGRKVSDFFLDFLGAQEELDARQQNKQLVEAVDAYCAVSELDKTEQQECKKQVYQYCQEQLSQGEELDVRQLSEAMGEDSEQGQSFYQFVKTDYELDESFPVERSALKTLTKYSGTGGGLSISFERALLGERVRYDAATDTLTIVGLPPNLKAELNPGQ
ncbi:nucleoid-associated protein YejK [Dongshaea marina]|uniref:nucleoid-associated protein YejK n=1 Tax=Dongshaea marina TaxID=2047966 RepID=UPI000D3EC3FD|nr:nucleoid-associated protein YejK [Dongshaea marina]